ncbi:hypothetical protein BOVMAS32_12830 [Streptococcus uberis]
MLIKQIKSEQVRINKKHSELIANHKRLTQIVKQNSEFIRQSQDIKSKSFHKRFDAYFNTQSK